MQLRDEDAKFSREKVWEGEGTDEDNFFIFL